MSTKWWTKSWNPQTGCTPISPGCQNCYAKTLAETRLRGRCGYDADDPFRVTAHPERLREPYSWRTPQDVFVGSMTDMFHTDTPPGLLGAVLDTMFLTPRHRYFLLTKRPANIPTDLLPPSNVRLGVTIENPDFLWRAERLAYIYAAVRFISFEPLLGPIPSAWLWDILARYKKIGGCWVICGAETGPGKRSMHLPWALDILDVCRDLGVPFFFKVDSRGRHILNNQFWEQKPFEHLPGQGPSEV